MTDKWVARVVGGGRGELVRICGELIELVCSIAADFDQASLRCKPFPGTAMKPTVPETAGSGFALKLALATSW